MVRRRVLARAGIRRGRRARPSWRSWPGASGERFQRRWLACGPAWPALADRRWRLPGGWWWRSRWLPAGRWRPASLRRQGQCSWSSPWAGNQVIGQPGEDLRAGEAVLLPWACSVVVLEAEVGDHLFAHDVAQGVLQLHGLDEQVVLGVEAGGGDGALEIEREPLLDAEAAERGGALGKIGEQDQVEDDGRGQDGVAAEEIHLDLHGVAEPAENVDVVPTFFIVAAGRVIVDAHLVVEILIQIGIQIGLEDVLEHAELGLLLGLEGFRIVEHLAVAVAEDVGREPAGEAEHPGLEPGRENGLHQGLAGLEVLAADGRILLAREREQGAGVGGEIGSAIGIGHAFLERGV